MERYELASEMSRRVQRERLRRNGIDPDTRPEGLTFEELSQRERDSWLYAAGAALDILQPEEVTDHV